MKIVKPYIDEHKQIIFIELENQEAHNFFNGLIFGQVVGGTIFIVIWIITNLLL